MLYCALDFLVLILALVALLNIILTLLLQITNHCVDCINHFLEVPCLRSAYPGSEGGKPQALCLCGVLFESSISLCHSHGTFIGTLNLEESSDVPACVVRIVCPDLFACLDGASKKFSGRICGKDVQCHLNSLNFFIAQVFANLPVVVFGQACGLRLIEELDIGIPLGC